MTVTDHFSTLFRSAAERLADVKPILWHGIRETLIYLSEFRHHAVAPDVRWGITQSVYSLHCGEIRWPDPEIQAEHPGARGEDSLLLTPTTTGTCSPFSATKPQLAMTGTTRRYLNPTNSSQALSNSLL